MSKIKIWGFLKNALIFFRAKQIKQKCRKKKINKRAKPPTWPTWPSRRGPAQGGRVVFFAGTGRRAPAWRACRRRQPAHGAPLVPIHPPWTPRAHPFPFPPSGILFPVSSVRSREEQRAAVAAVCAQPWPPCPSLRTELSGERSAVVFVTGAVQLKPRGPQGHAIVVVLNHGRRHAAVEFVTAVAPSTPATTPAQPG